MFTGRLLGGFVHDVLAIDENAAFGRCFKTREHAQQRGLAAARWAQQREEFAFANFEINIVNGDHFAEAFPHILKLNDGVALGDRGGAFGGGVRGRNFGHGLALVFLFRGRDVLQLQRGSREQNGDDDEDGRCSVDFWRHREAHHRIDFHRERDRVRPGGEEGDDEIVEAERERQERASERGPAACAAPAHP